MESLNIYIHIPFCPSKCPFCAFKTGVRHQSTIDAYIEKLCFEIKERLKVFAGAKVNTLYMGGGTPNLLPLHHIEKILDTVQTYVSIDPSSEITTEIHPNLMTSEGVKNLMNLGFNRFSIGVQSFNDSELNFLRRGYTSDEVQEKIIIAKDAGLKNLNLDFIIALPDQTSELLSMTIETSLSFNPQHLSFYLLSCDEGSHLTKEKALGRFTETQEDLASALYEQVCHQLDGVYHHYEISNWAKTDYECRHHLAFWGGKPYLGFGLSATSFWGDEYKKNISQLNDYLLDPLKTEEIVSCSTDEEKIVNKIIRQTRTREGVESDLFSAAQIQQLLSQQFVTLDENRIKLTPRGWLLNDAVIHHLIEARL